MRVCVRFYSDTGRIELPVHYNHIVQGFIYKNLDEDLAKKYHVHGFNLGKRVYKLFTFSRLKADKVRFCEKRKTLLLYGIVCLKVGAFHSEFLESFSIQLIRKGVLKIGENYCRLHSIEVEKSISAKEPVVVKAISPITVHRTMYTNEGKKVSIFYSPWDTDFSKLIKENLIRKAKLVYGNDYEVILEDPVIIPLNVSSGSQKIVLYKNYVIKGWLGEYKLNLSDPLLFSIAYYSGLGARNSMGFGMVDVVRKSEIFAKDF